MEKLILSLSIIIVGFTFGLLAKKIYIKATHNEESPTIIPLMRKIAFLGINPIVMIGAFWSIDIINPKLIVLPFICVAALAVGGVLGVVFGKIFKHSSKEKGAMFAVCSFSNLGTIGGLLCFSFLGEVGFAISACYVLFEAFYNYLLGYPICKFYAEGKVKESLRTKLKVLLDPTIIIYIGSVVVGLTLNLIDIQRPAELSIFNAYAIPMVSATIIFCLGFEIKVGKIREYAKECLAVIAVKYFFIPIFVAIIGLAMGLNKIDDGIIFKVLLIMSFTPSGFNSIIVSSIYSIDKDLCNSCWLTTMVALIVIVPMVYVLVNFIV